MLHFVSGLLVLFQMSPPGRFTSWHILLRFTTVTLCKLRPFIILSPTVSHLHSLASIIHYNHVSGKELIKFYQVQITVEANAAPPPPPSSTYTRLKQSDRLCTIPRIVSLKSIIGVCVFC